MFFGFSGGKTQQIWVSQKIRFCAFVSPLPQICLLVCRLFSSVLAGIKELTGESFVDFLFVGKQDRFENVDMSTFQQI